MEIKESTYEEFIKLNGTRMIETSYAKEIKEDKAKYYVIYDKDIFVTDFSVFEEENNLINMNIVLKGKEVLNEILKYFKDKYEFITIRTIDDLIVNNYQVINKEIIDEKLNLIDFTIKLK